MNRVLIIADGAGVTAALMRALKEMDHDVVAIDSTQDLVREVTIQRPIRLAAEYPHPYFNERKRAQWKMEVNPYRRKP